MAQNTSSAVMAQRAEPHDSLDYFPTPPWATRALCEFLAGAGCLRGRSCWEPASGGGDMVRPLGEYFAGVLSTDIHDYGWQDFAADFLLPAMYPPELAAHPPLDWVITNPPFRLAMDFALRALETAREGVALLVRTAFLEGGERHERLFRPHPPIWILQFCERVPMFAGRLDRKGSTATAYCWVVWHKPFCGSSGNPWFRWLPPCRKRLERPGDYPEAPAAGPLSAPLLDGGA